MQQNSNVIPQKRGFTPVKALLVYFGGIALFAVLTLYAVFCDFDVFGIFRRLAVPYTGSIFFAPQIEGGVGFYKEYFSRNHFILRMVVGFVCLLFVVKDTKKQEDKIVFSDFKFKGWFNALFAIALAYTIIKFFWIQSYLNIGLQLLSIIFCDISVIAFGVHIFKRARISPKLRFLFTLLGILIFYAIFICGMYKMSDMIVDRAKKLDEIVSIHNMIDTSVLSSGTSYNSVLLTDLLKQLLGGTLESEYVFRSLFMLNFGFTWQYFVIFILSFIVFIVPFYNWKKNFFVGGVSSFFFGNLFLNFVISVLYWYGPTEWLSEPYPHPSPAVDFFASVPKNFNGVVKIPAWMKLDGEPPVTIGFTELALLLLFVACVVAGIVFTVLVLVRKDAPESIGPDDYAFNGLGKERLTPAEIFKTKKVKLATVFAIGFLAYLALTALFSKQGLEENSVLIMNILEGRMFDGASLGNMSFDIQEFFASILRHSAVLTLIPLVGLTVFVACFSTKTNLSARSCFKICAMACCLCLLFMGHIFMLVFMAIIAVVFAIFAIFADKGKADQKSVYLVGKISCILLLIVDALFIAMYFYYGINNLLHNAPSISLLFNGLIYPFTLTDIKSELVPKAVIAALVLMVINHIAIFYSIMVVDGTIRSNIVSTIMFFIAAIGLFVMGGAMILLAFMAFNLMDFFALVVAGVVLILLAVTVLQLKPKKSLA